MLETNIESTIQGHHSVRMGGVRASPTPLINLKIFYQLTTFSYLFYFYIFLVITELSILAPHRHLIFNSPITSGIFPEILKFS